MSMNDSTNDHPDNARPLVLITGASGLIGTRIIEALSDNYKIVALDTQEPGPAIAGLVTFFECDLTSDSSTRAAFSKVRDQLGPNLASVIHLAAYYDFSGAPSSLYEDLTVAGTRRLMRALTQDFDVEQFVFSSSLLVMKPAEEGQLLDESSELQAEWEYPESKIRAEQVIDKEKGKIPAVILRLAGVYDEGGHSPPITQQIWRIRERKLESHFFPGDTEHGQSFVHLDDVVTCFARVVATRKPLGNDVFLIGEPETYSYEMLQDRIGELIHGQQWATMRIPASVAKAGAWIKNQFESEQFIKPWMIDLADGHYPIAIDHARDRLGWEPEHRLITSLSSMIEELNRNPDAWYRENNLPIESQEQAHEHEEQDRRA